jgi:hypothetical protein
VGQVAPELDRNPLVADAELERRAESHIHRDLRVLLVRTKPFWVGRQLVAMQSLAHGDVCPGREGKLEQAQVAELSWLLGRHDQPLVEGTAATVGDAVVLASATGWLTCLEAKPS